MSQQQTQIADLRELAESDAEGAVWSLDSEDLNANLIHLGAGQSIPEHVNGELDVVLVGVAGEGEVTVDGNVAPLTPGVLVYVPKGMPRQIVARSAGVVYLTCHRRRRGLMPERRNPLQ